MKDISNKSKQELIKEIRKLEQKIKMLKSKNPEGGNFIHSRPSENNNISLSKIPIAMWATDKNLLITSVNKETIKIFKSTSRQLLGKHASVLLKRVKSQEKPVLEGLQRALDGKSTGSIWEFNQHHYCVFIEPCHENKKEINGTVTILVDVTGQEQIERILRDKEERFSMILDNIDEFVYYIEYDIKGKGTVKYLSNQIENILGISKKGYLKNLENLKSLYHPDDIPLLVQSARKFKEEKIPQTLIYRFKHFKTNKFVWLEENVLPRLDDSKKLVGILGVMRNVTKRIEAEQTLRERERMLSTLMGSLPGMAYRRLHDNLWTMLFVSNGCHSLTGYTPEELVGNKKKSFAEIVFPEDRNIGKKEIELALKARTNFEFQYRIVTKNKKVKWVWEKGEGVFSDGCDLISIEGFIADITDRKEYEIKLERSRENYRNLVEYSPDGIFIHDEKGVVVFANSSAMKIMGIKSLNELDNKSIFNYALPEYHDEIKERGKKMENGGSLPFFAMEAKRPDGKIVEVEAMPIPFIYEGKKSVLVVFHDISYQRRLEREQLRAQIAEETNKKLQEEIKEREKAEQQLLLAQKYTRNLINSSLDMICACDNQGIITELNLAGLKTFGYAAKEIIGKHITCLYAYKEEQQKVNDALMRGSGSFAGEVLNIKKNGEALTVFLSASVLRNDAGIIIGSMGVSRDVTEKRKSEEQFKLQASKLNAVIESSSHQIWTVDKNLNIVSYNKNFSDFIKRIYGIDLIPFMNVSSGELLSTKEYEAFWEKKYRQVFKGIAQHFETTIKDKNGEGVWTEIYLNPIYDSKNKIVEVSGIAHDITEKKISEEQIKRSLQEKEVLLKEVHHRVKNNLQVVSSILNLQSSYIKDPYTVNMLKESQNRIKSMAFIHESLYQTKDFSGINFSEYIINLSKNLMHSYASADNKVELELDIEDVFLNLDLAIPCGLIINELVSNSLKYAFPEQKNGKISITLKQEQNETIIFISDNGIGLPKNVNFKNTDSLGLQLVVTLVEQLGGKIIGENKKGLHYTISFKHKQEIKKDIYVKN